MSVTICGTLFCLAGDTASPRSLPGGGCCKQDPVQIRWGLLVLLLALAQDQHDQAIEAEQGHSGKQHDGEAVRRLRDAGSAGRCGTGLYGAVYLLSP